MSKWRMLNLGSCDSYTIQGVYEAVGSSVGRELNPTILDRWGGLLR